MRSLLPITLQALALVACGGSQTAHSPTSEAPTTDAVVDETPTDSAALGEGGSEASSAAQTGEAAGAADADADGEPSAGKSFQLQDSKTAKEAHGVTASKIKPTKTEAAMKFIVVDKEKGPIPGIVIALTAPNGEKFYTGETDAAGYAEVLVPVGQKYELVYLSLGRRDVSATVPVGPEPNQNIKLTLRYKRFDMPEATPHFVLKGVNFDTGKATIRAESFPQLDGVVEYLSHKTNSRIEISGHTDNVGDPKANKALSTKRAQACRDYLIAKGVDPARIEAVGYGDERPIAPNDSAEGRQKNRRIEATEL